MPKEHDPVQSFSDMGFGLYDMSFIYGFLISVRLFRSACVYTQI